MNFKFKIDKEKNKLELKVSIPKRNKVSEKRIRVGWPTIKKLVDENFDCPKTHTLGKCKNPNKYLDNGYHKNSDVWTFELIPLQEWKPLKKKQERKPLKKKKVVTKDLDLAWKNIYHIQK